MFVERVCAGGLGAHRGHVPRAEHVAGVRAAARLPHRLLVEARQLPAPGEELLRAGERGVSGQFLKSQPLLMTNDAYLPDVNIKTVQEIELYGGQYRKILPALIL